MALYVVFLFPKTSFAQSCKFYRNSLYKWKDQALAAEQVKTMITSSLRMVLEKVANLIYKLGSLVCCRFSQKKAFVPVPAFLATLITMVIVNAKT